MVDDLLRRVKILKKEQKNITTRKQLKEIAWAAVDWVEEELQAGTKSLSDGKILWENQKEKIRLAEAAKSDSKSDSDSDSKSKKDRVVANVVKASIEAKSEFSGVGEIGKVSRLSDNGDLFGMDEEEQVSEEQVSEEQNMNLTLAIEKNVNDMYLALPFRPSMQVSQYNPMGWDRNICLGTDVMLKIDDKERGKFNIKGKIVTGDILPDHPFRGFKYPVMLVVISNGKYAGGVTTLPYFASLYGQYWNDIFYSPKSVGCKDVKIIEWLLDIGNLFYITKADHLSDFPEDRGKQLTKEILDAGLSIGGVFPVKITGDYVPKKSNTSAFNVVRSDLFRPVMCEKGDEIRYGFVMIDRETGCVIKHTPFLMVFEEGFEEDADDIRIVVGKRSLFSYRVKMAKNKEGRLSGHFWGRMFGNEVLKTGEYHLATTRRKYLLSELPHLNGVLQGEARKILDLLKGDTFSYDEVMGAVKKSIVAPKPESVESSIAVPEPSKSIKEPESAVEKQSEAINEPSKPIKEPESTVEASSPVKKPVEPVEPLDTLVEATKAAKAALAALAVEAADAAKAEEAEEAEEAAGVPEEDSYKEMCDRAAVSLKYLIGIRFIKNNEKARFVMGGFMSYSTELGYLLDCSQNFSCEEDEVDSIKNHVANVAKMGVLGDSARIAALGAIGLQKPRNWLMRRLSRLFR